MHPPPTANKFIPGRETAGQLRLSQPGMKTGYFPALRLSSSGAFLLGCCLGRRMCRARQVCAGPQAFAGGPGGASLALGFFWGRGGKRPREESRLPGPDWHQANRPLQLLAAGDSAPLYARCVVKGGHQTKVNPSPARSFRQPLLSCIFFEARGRIRGFEGAGQDLAAEPRQAGTFGALLSRSGSIDLPTAIEQAGRAGERRPGDKTHL